MANFKILMKSFINFVFGVLLPLFDVGKDIAYVISIYNTIQERFSSYNFLLLFKINLFYT